MISKNDNTNYSKIQLLLLCGLCVCGSVECGAAPSPLELIGKVKLDKQLENTQGLSNILMERFKLPNQNKDEKFEGAFIKAQTGLDLSLASIVEINAADITLSDSKNNPVEKLAQEILKNSNFTKDATFPDLSDLKEGIFDGSGGVVVNGTNARLNAIKSAIDNSLAKTSLKANKFKSFEFSIPDVDGSRSVVYDYLNGTITGDSIKLQDLTLDKQYASNQLAQNVYNAYKAYEDATANAKDLTDAELSVAKLNLILAPFAMGAGAAAVDNPAFKNAVKDLICQEFPEIGSYDNPLNMPALAKLDALITALHGAGGNGTPVDVATFRGMANVPGLIDNLKDGIKVAVKECKVSKAPGAANGLPALAGFDLQSIFEYSRTNLAPIAFQFAKGFAASAADTVDFSGVNGAIRSILAAGAPNDPANVAAMNGILSTIPYNEDGTALNINGITIGAMPAGTNNSGYLNDKSLGALIRSLAAICNNDLATNDGFRSADIEIIFDKFAKGSQTEQFFNPGRGIADNISLADIKLSKRAIAVIQLVKDKNKNFFNQEDLRKLFGQDATISIDKENGTNTLKNIATKIKDDALSDFFKKAPFGVSMPKADLIKLLLIAHFNNNDSVKNSTLKIADFTAGTAPIGTQNRALMLCPKSDIKIDEALVNSLNNLINSDSLFEESKTSVTDINDVFFDDTVEGASYQLLFELLGGRLSTADEDTKSIYGNKRKISKELKDVVSFVPILDKFRLMAKKENEQPLVDFLKKMGDQRKESQIPLLYFIRHMRENNWEMKNPLEFMKGLYALNVDQYDDLKKVLNPSAAGETPKHEYADVAKLTAALAGITTDTEIIKAIAALFEKKADATQNDKDKVQKFLEDNKKNATNDVIIKILELKLLKSPFAEETNAKVDYKDLGFSDEDSKKLKALVDKINAANFDPKTLTEADRKLFADFETKATADEVKKAKYQTILDLKSKLKEQAPVPTPDPAKELADKKTEATGLLDKHLADLSKAAYDQMKAKIGNAKAEEIASLTNSLKDLQKNINEIESKQKDAKEFSAALSELEGKLKDEEKKKVVKALLDAINKVVTDFDRIKETRNKESNEGLAIDALNGVIKCKDANNNTVDITPAKVIKALDEAVKDALKKLTQETDDAKITKMAETTEAFKAAISKFAEATEANSEDVLKGIDKAEEEALKVNGLVDKAKNKFKEYADRFRKAIGNNEKVNKKDIDPNALAKFAEETAKQGVLSINPEIAEKMAEIAQEPKTLTDKVGFRGIFQILEVAKNSGNEKALEKMTKLIDAAIKETSLLSLGGIKLRVAKFFTIGYGSFVCRVLNFGLRYRGDEITPVNVLNLEVKETAPANETAEEKKAREEKEADEAAKKAKPGAA